MPYCPHCGTAYAEADRFCGECGAEITEKEAPPGDGPSESSANRDRDDTPTDAGGDTPERAASAGSTSLTRKVFGVISGLIVAFWGLLILRQLGQWSATGDGYYLVSSGMFVVIVVLLWAGVAWGFFRGERAKQVFGGVAALVGMLCFLASLYFWVTGRVIGNDVNAIVSALVWGFTGIVVYVTGFVIPKLVSVVR